jgi:hypothetical protein
MISLCVYLSFSLYVYVVRLQKYYISPYETHLSKYRVFARTIILRVTVKVLDGLKIGFNGGVRCTLIEI